MREKWLLVCLLAALLAVAAWADTIACETDGGSLSACATFSRVGSNLQVLLENTSGVDVLIPVEILTAVFFTLSENPTLTPVSAVLTDATDEVFFDVAPVGGVVGGEWAYLASTFFGQGISSAGFGIFGNANFPGPGLDSPAAVDGLNYGITSAGDNSATGNAEVTGNVPLIKNSVTFQLSGLPADFNVDSGVSRVIFQYGTGLTEGPRIPPSEIPEPGTWELLGLGALLLGGGWVRRRLA